MARAPDWLLNSMSNEKSLIDDSPQFRKLEQSRQKQNLSRAAASAMQEVDKRIAQTEQETMQTRLEREALATPFPVPLSGPKDPLFETAPVPTIPGPDEFDSSPILAEDQAMQDDFLPPEDDSISPDPNYDVAASVQRISDVTGIPVDKVALMTLLGKDIARIQAEAQNSPPTMPPPVATPVDPSIPTPLEGPLALNATPPMV